MFLILFFLSFFSNQLHCSSKVKKVQNFFITTVAFVLLIAIVFLYALIKNKFADAIVFVTDFILSADEINDVTKAILLILFFSFLMYIALKIRKIANYSPKILIYQKFNYRKEGMEVAKVILIIIVAMFTIFLPVIVNYKFNHGNYLFNSDKITATLFLLYVCGIFYCFFKFLKNFVQNRSKNLKHLKFSINFQKSFNDFKNVITISDENGVCAQAKDVEKINIINFNSIISAFEICIQHNNGWFVVARFNYSSENGCEIEILKNGKPFQTFSPNETKEGEKLPFIKEKEIDLVFDEKIVFNSSSSLF